MNTSRRAFLRVSALAGGSLGAGMVPGLLGDLLAGVATGEGTSPVRRAAGGGTAPGRSLRILLLGGTGFIGPWQVRFIRERGHTLTLFNRGRTEPGLFGDLIEGLETLVGDRDGDLTALEGTRSWDVVIDNSGYTPEQVRATARLLQGRVPHYVFISTQAAYASRAETGIGEDAPLGIAGVPESEWDGYGPLKALAEREVRAAYGEACTIVRPGVVAGPGDRTDRFTYWPVRMDRGGEVLVPDDPEGPIQFIDVRDLTEWMVRLVEGGVTGTFNAIGPEGTLSLRGFLYGVKAVTSTPSSFVSVPPGFLDSQGVAPQTGMPLWVPARGGNAGFARMSRDRAIAAGLTYRPLATTARDTLEWWRGLPAEERTALRTGPTPEREAAVIAEWRSAGGGRA